MIKIATNNNGKLVLKLSKSDWIDIGKNNGWIKSAGIDASQFIGQYAVMKKQQTGPRSFDYKVIDIAKSEDDANTIASQNSGSKVRKIDDVALISDWVRKNKDKLETPPPPPETTPVIKKQEDKSIPYGFKGPTLLDKEEPAPLSKIEPEKPSSKHIVHDLPKTKWIPSGSGSMY